MAKTLNDILKVLNTEIGKTSADTPTEQSAKITLINFAKDFIISQLGLPSSERTYSIRFIDGKEKYALPADFLEPISLNYEPSFLDWVGINKSSEFDFRWPGELLKLNPISGIVFWGFDYVDGVKSLIIKAKNSIASTTINEADSLDGWSTLNDATNLRLDSVRSFSGKNSLRFTIDETISGNSRATIKLSLASPLNFEIYKKYGTFYTAFYIQNSTGISSITLKWGTDASNYWYVVQTRNSDNQVFQTGWNEVVWDWSDASAIGNPDERNITFLQWDIDYDETSFVSPQDWNIDKVKIVFRDVFVLRYYSENVVKDGTSGQLKKDFQNTNDIALFADVDASLINLIGMFAALRYRELFLRDQSDLLVVQNKRLSELLLPYTFRFPKRTPMFYRGRFENPAF